MYRVDLVVIDLGLVDFNWECPTILLGQSAASEVALQPGELSKSLSVLAQQPGELPKS